MKNPKFKLGDLVHRKYEFSDDNVVFLEVMQINIVQSSNGTEIDYYCRAMLLKKEYKSPYLKSGDFKWELVAAIWNKPSDNNVLGFTRLIESELVLLPEKYLSIIYSLQEK
ncbi:MAG: hypothetical protein ACRCVT_10160 [Leadbetterella sp.]